MNRTLKSASATLRTFAELVSDRLDKPTVFVGRNSAKSGTHFSAKTGVASGFCRVRLVRKIYPALNAFTPCSNGVSLLEKNDLSAKCAAFGDVILLSPACSSFNQFRNPKSAEEVSSSALNDLADAMGCGFGCGHHNRQTGDQSPFGRNGKNENNFSNLLRGFLRKNPGAINPTIPQPERTLYGAINS